MLKFSFHIFNFILIFSYLFPGQILGCLFYGNCEFQPKLTNDFIISSNHFYVFIIISTLGVLTYFRLKKLNYLFGFLIFYSIILEVLHILIPNRAFQYEDLFGNLYGVLIVIIFWNIFKFYEKNK